MTESLKEKVDRLRQEQDDGFIPTFISPLPMPDTPSKLDTFYETAKKLCGGVAMIFGTVLLIAFTCWVILTMR